MTYAPTASTPSPRATGVAQPGVTHDPLLLPFVQAKTAERAEEQLGRLIWAIAHPIIRATVRRCLPHDPVAVDDIGADVLSRIAARLQAARQEASTPLPNFTAYVRVASKNACLNYAAKKRETCFSSLGGGSESYGMGHQSPDDCLAGATNVEAHVSRRAQLQAVWKEIQLLPSTQRAVLLLNLRAPDNSSALRFLAAADATLAQVARALNLTDAELAELIPLLPMDDAGIALRLSVSPTEIRTMRLAARRRLTRRARAWM